MPLIWEKSDRSFKTNIYTNSVKFFVLKKSKQKNFNPQTQFASLIYFYTKHADIILKYLFIISPQVFIFYHI